ncbi:MAG: hypothetical protein AAF596_05515 [Planctomycetota bacterium]
MISLLRQRCLNTLLAAIYLIVGATGDSLHYLVESPAPSASADEHLAGAFAHEHGDGLWHHHGHHHDGAVAAATNDGVSDDANDNRGRPSGERGFGFSEGGAHHTNHSCALLAIASEIEISLLAGSPAVEPVQALPIDATDADALVGASPRSTLGARGPPRAIIA